MSNATKWLRSALVLAAIGWAPQAKAALPSCMSQCAHTCGRFCLGTHTCLLRDRFVYAIDNQPGVYLVVCRYRGGYRTNADGVWFCCGHTIHTHDHSGFGTL